MKCFCVVQHFPSNWGVVVVQDVLGIARRISDLVSARALPRKALIITNLREDETINRREFARTWTLATQNANQC